MAPTAPINDPLSDFFPFTLDALTFTESENGTKVPNGVGDVLNIPCRLSMKNRKVGTSAGKEIVSSYKVICNGAFGLDVKSFVYNLPTAVPGPHTELEALSIRSPQDEGGIHHQSVFFE